MPWQPVVRVRDRVSLSILLLLAVVLGGGVYLRVRYLQREMLTRWRQALDGGALTTQATLDEWFAERSADASALASNVAVHATVSNAGGDPARPFAQVLAPIHRRGKFVGVWVLDSAGRVLSGPQPDSIRRAERDALREALASNRLTHSSVMPLGQHAALLSFVSPVQLPGPPAAGSARPAAVLLRADVVAAFSPWASGRPNAAMSLFATPSPDGPVIITACPGQNVPVCISRASQLRRDDPAAIALTGVDTFGIFRSFEGGRVLAVSRFDTALKWGVVRRVNYSDAVVPLRTELAVEGAFLAVLLALGGVAAYAANRTVRVRRLDEERKAAERLAIVVDASTDGVISLDEHFNIAMVNGAVERLLGYSRATLVGRPVFTLFAEQWHASLAESLQAFAKSSVARAPIAETERCIARGADGRLIPVDARVGRAILDGVPLYVMGLRDVSERARAEAFLQGQRHVLELIASGAPAPETMGVLLGVLEDEAPLMQCAVHELDAERQIARIVSAPSLPQLFVAAMSETPIGPTSGAVGSAMLRESSVFTPDISTDALWDDSRAAAMEAGVRGAWAIPLRAADGRVIGALSCYYDSARHPSARERDLVRAAVHLASIALSSARDAAALRASEASFRSLVENAPAAIFRETRNGVLVSTNPAMVALLGHANVQLLRHAADEGRLYHDPEARVRLIRALEEEGVVRSHEVEWRRGDDSLVTVRLSARAYRDDRGDVWLWQGYAEDVTSLRATEGALRRSERLAAVGQLISGVAHELNNPLSSIMHFAEDLLSDDRSTDDAEALGVIRDQARRSRAIVRDLLSFVHQRDANAEPVALAEVVTATVRAMRPSLEHAGVELTMIEGSARTYVLADRAGIEQIVTNLVSNAAQAAGRGGSVWVQTASASGGCELVVEDSGAGIAEDVLPRIFDPFFTTKPTGEGTGLGLSVTLGIVEQFGGRIAVDPHIAGRGSRFTVFLPCLDEEARRAASQSQGEDADGVPAETLPSAAPASSTAPFPPGGVLVPEKIALIIDDEPTIRAALKRYFTRRGWSVEEAADGSAGLALLEHHGDRIGVVISDLRMPGFSGIQLHDQLAVQRPELLRRFVFSTGDVASTEAASFVHRTACPVLQKPFELRMLDGIVAGVTEGAAAERVIT